jgi:hypothetical protein
MQRWTGPLHPLRRRPWLLTTFVLLALLILATALFAQTTHSAGWVAISVEDYQALRAKAYPSESPLEPPPVDATLSRVEYDLRVSGEIATGRATLTVDVLKDGWVRVPIPNGLLVRRATLEGKPVALVPGPPGKNKNHLAALLSHAGRFVLVLDLDAPVTYAAGVERMELPAADSGITRATLQLPEQNVDHSLTGGLTAEESEAGGQTHWVAFARGAEPLTFSWKKKTEDHRVTQPLRLRGSLTQLTSLGEDSSSISAEVNLEVVQGVAREARLQLPPQITVNQVSGAMIADWETKSGELTVTFLEPVEQNVSFTINGEVQSLHEGQISVPLLRLLGTERDTGGVAVEVLGAGEILPKDVKSEGLEAADANDLGEMVASRQSPQLVAFDYHAGNSATNRSLSVHVVRYQQQAVLMANIEEARYHILSSNDGKTLVRVQYAVRNNQRNFAKVTLPAGAVLWDTLVAGKPVRPGQSPDGSLLLPLQKSRGDDAPVFVAELLYWIKTSAWGEKGNFSLALPSVDLPVSRTGLLFYYPPFYKVTAQSGTFSTQEYAVPASPVLEPGEQSKLRDQNEESAIITRRTNAKDEEATQKLLDQYRASSVNSRTGILPISISFPEFGPSTFLVSELTSEGQTPTIQFSYERDKKAGGR